MEVATAREKTQCCAETELKNTNRTKGRKIGNKNGT